MFSSCVMMLCNSEGAHVVALRLTVPTSSMTGGVRLLQFIQRNRSIWLYVRGLMGRRVS